MKKLLLVDLCTFKGHHETYFMRALSTFTKNGYYVYAHTVENSKLESNILSLKLINCEVIDLSLTIIDKIFRYLLILLDHCIQALHVKTYIQFSSLCNLIATYRLIKEINQEIPVFFAHIDSVLPAVPRWVAKYFMPRQWSGIYIMPSYRSLVSFGVIRKRQIFLSEKNLGLLSCKSLLVLDPEYQRFINRIHPWLKCIYLPESCEIPKDFHKIHKESIYVSQIKSLSNGRIVIALLGALTRRKNLLFFLELASKLDPKFFFPVVVGQLYHQEFSQDEISQIRTLEKKLKSLSFIKLDYYIPSQEEFDCLLAISDIVYLQYKNHPFSSNILARSIKHRKPVIVNPGYLMEKVLVRYKWQAVTSELLDQTLQAVNLCVNEFKIDEESYQDFSRQHSIENIQTSLLGAVNKLEQ